MNVWKVYDIDEYGNLYLAGLEHEIRDAPEFRWVVMVERHNGIEGTVFNSFKQAKSMADHARLTRADCYIRIARIRRLEQINVVVQTYFRRPTYHHHCKDCHFLGRCLFDGRLFDLYLCMAMKEPGYMVRWGDAAEESSYCSTEAAMKKFIDGVNDPFSETFRRYHLATL